MASDIVRRSSLIPAQVIALVLVSILAIAGDSRAQSGSTPDSGVTPLDFLPALAGDYLRLDSEAVGRPFHIYVNLPQSYSSDSAARYPVVYVLDGDSLFPIIAPTHLFLTVDNDVPEAVIVGIAYGSFDASINKRGYDFTAPAADADPDQGGAERFQKFLRDELIPAIGERYRVDPDKRVLFGQSRSGGMVLYSAFTDPDLFWGRIASNPTFEPGREMYFSRPARATKDDLRLVVTSGSEDQALLREVALEWFSAWQGAEDLPWRLHTATIDGGTHAAFSPISYRTGMLWLYGLQE
jgi:predicted alpha/beta superfamily hydrolase